MKVLRKAKFLSSEKGSASVEFVLLAIPLFVPLIIFLQQFGNLSYHENIARTLAREGARAFVTSSSAQFAEIRMNSVIRAVGQELGMTEDDFGRLSIGLECGNNPCFSSKGKVIVTIHLGATNDSPAITASAQEYISPWS